jgi:hypothetical protein
MQVDNKCRDNKYNAVNRYDLESFLFIGSLLAV